MEQNILIENSRKRFFDLFCRFFQGLELQRIFAQEGDRENGTARKEFGEYGGVGTGGGVLTLSAHEDQLKPLQFKWL